MDEEMGNDPGLWSCANCYKAAPDGPKDKKGMNHLYRTDAGPKQDRMIFGKDDRCYKCKHPREKIDDLNRVRWKCPVHPGWTQPARWSPHCTEPGCKVVFSIGLVAYQNPIMGETREEANARPIEDLVPDNRPALPRGSCLLYTSPSPRD